MKTIKIIFVLIILSTILGYHPRSALAATNTTVTFNLSNSRNIPKFINGINQNWFVESPVTYNYVQDAFNRIGTNLVRFPGGTVGNYYDWETFTPDWDAGARIYDNPGQLNQIKSRFETFVQTLDPITTIRAFNQQHKQVILTLNVFSNTPEQIAIGLNKIKAAGLSPKYFELGNEMYAHMPMQQYFQKSKLVARKVKTIFPNAQIGLVARKGLWGADTNKDWPKTDNPPNEDWFDAVIFHTYMGPGSQMPPAQQINHILFDPVEKLGNLVTNVHAKYPGKKLWLTEWNIWETANEGFFMTNTYAYAVFHYNFLLSMLKFPAITIANHHILWTSRSWQFALLTPKQSIVSQYYNQNTNPPNNTYSFDQFFVKSPAYWPMSWIGQAFTKYSKFTLINNNELTAAYFFNTGEPEKGSVAIINKTGVNQNVTFGGIGNGSRTAFVLVKNWLAPNSESNEMRPTTRSMTTSLTLAPYAIAYSAPPTSPSLPGDFNDDGKVDLSDYNLLISNFGNPYTIFDYNLVVANWNK